MYVRSPRKILGIPSAEHILAVAFYSSADCDEKNIVASTNDGCVGTLNPVGYEKNEYYFSVVQNYNGKREEDTSVSDVNPDLKSIRKRSPEEDQALMDANCNSTGSLNPLWDPLAVQRSGTSHGDVEEDVLGYNVTVRWWQAAQGIFIGIPLDEWDDNVHIASDEWIPFGDTYPFDYTASQRHINVGIDPSADLDELAKRADFKGMCTGFGKSEPLTIISRAHCQRSNLQSYSICQRHSWSYSCLGRYSQCRRHGLYEDERGLYKCC